MGEEEEAGEEKNTMPRENAIEEAGEEEKNTIMPREKRM